MLSIVNNTLYYHGMVYIYFSIYFSTDNFVLLSPLVEGLNKTCTNISIFLINDDRISPPRRFSIMLDTYYIYEDRITFPSEANATLYIEDDGMYIHY